MARNYFNPESLVWKPLGYLGDCVLLSLLWGLCSIPLITVGASTAALYDAVVHAVRRQDDRLFSRFFSTFRRELLSASLSTLLWAAILFAEGFACARLADLFAESGHAAAIRLAALLFLGFFTLCVLAWVFPMLSRFTLRTGALNVTALRLGCGNILRSAALALLIGASTLLCELFATPAIVLPGLAALLASYLIEPVFARYEASQGEDGAA